MRVLVRHTSTDTSHIEDTIQMVYSELIQVHKPCNVSEHEQ
jgi:hypothetical protein